MRTRTWAIVLAAAVSTAVLAAAPAFAGSPKAAAGTSFASATPIGISTDVLSCTVQMHTFAAGTQASYVKFSAQKGTTYDLKVLGPDETSSGHWMKVAFFRYDKAKRKWSQAGGEVRMEGGSNTYTRVTASASTTYAVRVRPYRSAGAGMTYGLRLIKSTYPAVQADSYETKDNALPGATVLPAQQFDPTSWQHNGVYDYTMFAAFQLHSISPASDDDWYAVTLPANQWSYVAFSMGDCSDQTITVDVCDAQGTPLVATQTMTYEYCTANLDLPDGATYYVHVRGNGAKVVWYRIGLVYAPQ
jgi:hypothetical protein